MHISFCPSFKMNYQIILAILLFIFTSNPLHSQTLNADATLAEKIYLQLDATIYTTDQTIWFKSIVANATDHTPTTLSGVLYVELIGPDEKIVEKKLIKIENGIGNSFFELDQEYTEGLYLIRAYTEWNKNFGTDFFFKQYIRVFAISSKEEADPIRNVTLVEMQNNNRRLTAYFDPFAIDSLYEDNKLIVFITLDDKKDSLTIKKNRDDTYLLFSTLL